MRLKYDNITFDTDASKLDERIFDIGVNKDDITVSPISSDNINENALYTEDDEDKAISEMLATLTDKPRTNHFDENFDGISEQE